MNIIMMGAQGTGKGTVAGILKDKLNIPQLPESFMGTNMLTKESLYQMRLQTTWLKID